MLFMQNTCHQVNSYPNNHSHDQHPLDHSNIESFRLVVHSEYWKFSPGSRIWKSVDRGGGEEGWLRTSWPGNTSFTTNKILTRKVNSLYRTKSWPGNSTFILTKRGGFEPPGNTSFTTNKILTRKFNSLYRTKPWPGNTIFYNKQNPDQEIHFLQQTNPDQEIQFGQWTKLPDQEIQFGRQTKLLPLL